MHTYMLYTKHSDTTIYTHIIYSIYNKQQVKVLMKLYTFIVKKQKVVFLYFHHA